MAGKGNFTVGQGVVDGVVPRAVVAVDLDGDGRADVATANQSSNDAVVLLDPQTADVVGFIPLDPY